MATTGCDHHAPIRSACVSYTVRHQVFVSSTFTDLKDERAEVIQAVWELDCIPTGMEAFVASNESQWDVIKRVIDECDYYVLIIGGRYGSTTTEGLSYTEKEYRYAKSIGLPVLAFTHSDPGQIPVAKSDFDTSLREKLTKFRDHIRETYPVRGWLTASELGGLVSRSLVREIRINPRPGWIRNDGASPVALMERLSALTEENAVLREQGASANADIVDESLEQGSDTIVLEGSRQSKDSHYNYKDEIWTATVSWDMIFKDLGPSLIGEATEQSLKNILAHWNTVNSLPKGYQLVRSSIYDDTWAEVFVQLRALGLIEPGVKKRAVSDKGSYWKITTKGDKHLVNLLARRRTAPA